ncbi:MAG TPA: citramalate synthase [Peptococcaceae bacterium]|nr:citramalate synthase [Peptococcaceae bacterium]
MKKVSIYDTTLRDGTQGEGISLSLEDKIKIALKIDSLGVDYIEGGWPGSNPKDMEFFKRIKEYKLQHAVISAFGSTRKPNIPAEEDKNLRAILESGVKTAAIFGKSWDFHVEKALRTTLEENLRMIEDSVRFLKNSGLEVFFDAEHFFDGYKNNPQYAMEAVKAAESAGADVIVLCETNGGSLPHEVEEIVGAVVSELSTPVGIHTHNDGELAVANSIMAVRAGAVQVQGTINGYGERCGNCNLCSVIPNLQLKGGYQCIPEDKLKMLTEVALYVSEVANQVLPNNQPFVGRSAFAHKGGIHASAILKDGQTYEHIPPEKVGNKRRVIVSELSGASNLKYKAKEMGIDLDALNGHTRKIVEKIKQLEHEGFQFESAEGSLELLLRKALKEYVQSFVLDSFRLIIEKQGDKESTSEAVMKLKVGDEIVHTAAEGNGPVNALDNCLRKALEEFYPFIKNVHLTDYKVRVLDEKDGTAAKVRVFIETRDATSSWTTVGVSENIIEASWQALMDSIDYALLKYQKEQSKRKAEKRSE